MPGLPIIFRLINVGFSEPTTIYQVVEKDGKWEMRPEVEMGQASVDDIQRYIMEYAVAPYVPVIIPDDMMRVKYELKQRGIHVR